MNGLALREGQWQLWAAKNKLSNVIERAAESPQTITVRGKEAAVVISVDLYKKLTEPKKSLVASLAEIGGGFLEDEDMAVFDRDKSTQGRATPLDNIFD